MSLAEVESPTLYDDPSHEQEEPLEPREVLDTYDIQEFDEFDTPPEDIGAPLSNINALRSHVSAEEIRGTPENALGYETKIFEEAGTVMSSTLGLIEGLKDPGFRCQLSTIIKFATATNLGSRDLEIAQSQVRRTLGLGFVEDDPDLTPEQKSELVGELTGHLGAMLAAVEKNK